MALGDVFSNVHDLLSGVFGETATLRNPTRVFDPNTGEVSGTNADVTVKIQPPERLSAFSIANDLGQRGDLVVEISAKGIAVLPTKSMQLILAGETYNIVEVDNVRINGTIVSWRVQCRLT